MGHDTLENHLKTNFNLAEMHSWSFSDIDGMLPWERSIYLELLMQKIRNETQREMDQMLHTRR